MSSHTDDVDRLAPLDVLLSDAALGSPRRFTPDSSTARWMSALARRPRTTARRLGDLLAESGRIAAGASTLAPERGDRRFKDPAWNQNPLLSRTVQFYLAAGRTAEQLLNDAELEWRDERRARFLVENLVEALAPSNLPLVNPESAKEAINTGGASLLRGARQLVRDQVSAPRTPEMVDTSPFTVGENIAATPGAVVFRSEVLELIQYTPQTEEVFDVPLLLVPPTINKFYAMDLAPDRSLVEASLKHGHQTFVISWRNPDGRHAAWDLETYVRAVVASLQAVLRITESEKAVLSGVCAGGILASITAAYLYGIGQQGKLAALCLAVTVLDNRKAGTLSALSSRRAAEAAKEASRRQGYLDGRNLAEVFAWLRPRDLIWNYWVNNYLLGKRPPAFDILFWNADTTRMTAGLHADFVDIALENALVEPGKLTVLGIPIDLSSIDVDAYVVAGIADHITPWQNCYRTTGLLGCDTRFVLSNNGHIAALVNPPGNPKSIFYTNKDNPPTGEEWLRSAEVHEGTWWDDIPLWLEERSGKRKPAPAALGGPGFEPLTPAPGTYVFDY